jgi:cytochrome c oxidase subunit 3
MSSTTHGTTPYYFVPGPSAYPVWPRSACSS